MIKYIFATIVFMVALFITGNSFANEFAPGMTIPDPWKIGLDVDDIDEYEEQAGLKSIELLVWIRSMLKKRGFETELGGRTTPPFSNLFFKILVKKDHTYYIYVEFSRRLFFEEDGKRINTRGALWTVVDIGVLHVGPNASKANRAAILAHIDQIIHFFYIEYFKNNGVPDYNTFH